VSVGCHLCIHIYSVRLSEAVGASRREAHTAGVRLAVIGDSGLAAARTSGGGCEGGLNVLLIHEHHLKAIGSDLRLLGLLLQLREQGHTVSLLFRGKASRAERSPPTSELNRIIGGPALDDPAQLGGSGAPPPHPAIYELADLAGLASLASQGWFDAVLCSFWFWRDPAPSAAELLLPTLLTNAPRGRRPFIGVLSDDAHSAKAAMMAGWEPAEERKAMWRGKMRSLPPRQAAVYSLADAVVHISDSDSRLERVAFNGTARAWLVVRMSLRSFTRDAATSTGVNRNQQHLRPKSQVDTCTTHKHHTHIHYPARCL